MPQKRWLLLFLILLPLSLLSYHLAAGQGEPPPPVNAETLAQVETAIRQSLNQNRELTLVTIVYATSIENLRLSSDQQWGRAHLVPVDPQSGEFITSEPGLAVVKRQPDGGWDAILPADPRWAAAVQAAPPDLLSEAEKTVYLQMYAEATAEPNAGEPFGGYYLPWAQGVTIGLSRSITHHNPVNPDGNMHYSFDFYYPTAWYNHDLRMFDLHAARPGVVWLWRDIVPNCYDYTCTDDPSHETLGNYIVIKDDSTDPDTYQLYLHLAQGSIPAGLKWQGAPVGQGAFIGKVDNTGQSWGHHLHFQVHTNPYSYWGHAQDILFNEVTINGGRPRTLTEATQFPQYGNQGQSYYVSANPPPGDRTPPIGDLLAPLTGEIYTTSIFMEGWASDADPGLQSARFMAFYNGSWQWIGPEFSTALFSYTWDWCAAGVPDGPVSLALRLVDQGGIRTTDLPGLRHVIKAGGCAPQPPACIPATGQVALFSELNYGGTCQILTSGVYTDSYTFGEVGSDNTASILLGSGARATLYSEPNLQGRSESFAQSDPNLAENRIGSDTLASLQVWLAADLPAAPDAQWPADASTFNSSTSLDFFGMDRGGGTQFRLRLENTALAGEAQPVLTTAWGSAPFWPLGNLAAGTYSWSIQAANLAGESAWSTARSFTVSNDSTPPPPTTSAPFSDTFDDGDTSDWTTNGSWAPSIIQAKSGSHSFRYSYPAAEASTPHFGDLTSRPINLPVSANPYYLSFYYKYESESFYPHWDQRRVQISVDGAPFTDIYQLVYDPNLNEATAWMQAIIDLSPYYAPGSPHTVRVRFHFHSGDGAGNDYEGWYIEDVSLAAGAPPLCSDGHEPNDAPASATPIAYGNTRTAAICPAGDYDWYVFSGNAGDRLRVDINAKVSGSDLDAILYLVDTDGSSVLAFNDDEVPISLQDPLLDYRLPRSGVYYLRVQAWNHPKGSGAYSLSLLNDNHYPTVILNAPASNSLLSRDPLDLIAIAADVGSGLTRVEFWYHTDDWLGADWQLLFSDSSGADGWRTTFDPGSLAEMDALALLVAAYDLAGNAAFAAAWDLRTDTTPPSVNLNSLPNPLNTTALRLQWQASDSRSGLARVDIDLNLNSGGWNTLHADTTASGDRWYIGQPGSAYAMRASAVDQAGNSNSDTFSTSIPAAATLCSAPDPWDVSTEHNDNSAATASLYPLGVTPQTRNFCNPAASDRLSDEDWLSLAVTTGQRLVFLAQPQTDSAAVVVGLYASDGSSLLAEQSPVGFGQPTSLTWLVTEDGTLYLRLRHSDGRVAGNGVSYSLIILHQSSFFPILRR